MSFAGELAYGDWKELMDIVNKSMAEKLQIGIWRTEYAGRYHMRWR